MLKIAFEPVRGEESCRVIVNGRVDSNSRFSPDANLWVGDVSDSAVIARLLDHSFEELSEFFSHLVMPAPRECTDRIFSGAHETRLIVTCGHLDETDDPTIGVELSIRSHSWKRPWSIDEFEHALELACNRYEAEGAIHVHSSRGSSDRDGEEYADLYLEFSSGSREIRVRDAINMVVPRFERIISEATASLVAKLDENSLSVYFNSTPATRTACAQYLMYFSQFLRDLDIKADSQLKEEASRILFSVTPRDGQNALALINGALSVYLGLPSAVRPSNIEHGDIAVAQLQAVVLHFQSQMLLATATASARQRSIQMLEDANRQLAASRADLSASSTGDKEVLLGGIATLSTLSKFRNWGIEIDLAKLYRRLRRRND